MSALKTISLLKRIVCATPIALVLMLSTAHGQICSDPVNTIYGLTNAGFIYPINVNTGVVGSALNPAYAGNPPNQSNGVGYNSINGKFYYFKRIPSAAPTEFVSFDPSTMAVTLLSSPVTTNSIFPGCVNNKGTGYYCWDTNGTLFYYDIANNIWTTITSTIVDQYGKDVDSIFRIYGSGDGAIDGKGNMLMLPSSAAKYALFRLNAPLPTTAVASVTVTEIQPLSTPPASFVGIALNTTGQIFISTNTSKMYRLESNLTLTFLSNLTMGMGDLTSCNFPMASLLPLADNHFTAALKNDRVAISWQKNETNNAKTYSIEYSVNAVDWKTIGTINDDHSSGALVNWVHNDPKPGKNYYRLKIQMLDNAISYSSVRTVVFTGNGAYGIWPNPVKNTLFIQHTEKADDHSQMVISDLWGRKIKASGLISGINSIDLTSFVPGTYVVTLSSANGDSYSYKVVKN